MSNAITRIVRSLSAVQIRTPRGEHNDCLVEAIRILNSLDGLRARLTASPALREAAEIIRTSVLGNEPFACRHGMRPETTVEDVQEMLVADITKAMKK